MAGVDTRSPYPGEGRRRGLGFLLNALARDAFLSGDGEGKGKEEEEYGPGDLSEETDGRRRISSGKWELVTRSPRASSLGRETKL